MELFTAAVALLFAAFVGYLLLSWMRDSKDLPPGPPSLPILGSTLWMSYPMRCWVLSTPQRYGPICTFVLDGRRFVVLNSFEAVREAFLTQSADFSGRQRNVFTAKVTGNSGFLSGEGSRWKQLRRFSLHALRDFGFGKTGSEEAITKEALELVAALEASEGRPTSTSMPFNKAVSNVICSLVFGSRVADEDPDFEAKLALINKITQSSPTERRLLTTLAMAAQRLVAPERMLSMPFAKKMVGLFESVFTFCQDRIDAKQAAYDPADEPQDYIEAFLAERHRLADASPDARIHLGDKDLQVGISDLFLAGTDTTANSLRWIALHLALHPELQERLARYVRDRLGARRPPSMADRTRMPLIEAFLLEAQRFYTLVPTGVAHRATADARLLGYRIPKDTVVLANLQAVHFEAASFPQPEVFNPDRFLDAEGRFRPSDRVIPFSIGKRSCLGESLARMELFLFAVALLQAFRIGIPAAEKERLEEIRRFSGGVVHSPGQHELVFQRREED